MKNDKKPKRRPSSKKKGTARNASARIRSRLREEAKRDSRTVSKSDKAHLVDGKYSVTDLIDINRLKAILERFSLATGFSTGFVTFPGQEVLIATGWRDICTKFHRAFPGSARHCTESNVYLTGRLRELKELSIRRCGNGLMDGATPVIVKGTHIASLATGQVLFEEPDIEKFTRQAEAYGYDVDAYLRALREVPVVSEEKFRRVLAFLSEIAVMLAELGLASLEIREGSGDLEQKFSEGKRTREELEKSRRFLSDVFESIQEGVSVLDTDLIVHRVNRVMKNWYAKNLPLEGKKCYRCYHDKGEACHPCPALRCISSRRTEREIVPGLPGSDVEWVELFCYPILDEDSGEVTGVVEFVRDITERRHADMKLRESEERFRTIFDNAKDAMFVETPEGNILDVNKAACSMLGYTREQILKMMVSDVVTPQKAALLSPTIRREFIRDGIYVETEELLKGNRRISVEVSNTLVEIGGKKRVIAILRDISARKKTEEALKESEEKYRALVENSPDVIMRFDRELRHTFVSRSVRQYVDIPPEYFLGKSHRELGFPLNMCDFWEEHIQKVFERGEPHQVEFELQGKSEKIYFEWLLIPEHTPEQTIDAVLAISRDITERKRFEEQLRHAQKMEAVGTLAGGLAHDFNNILAGIMGYASLAKNELRGENRLYADMETIEKLSLRGRDLTNALLAFSRKGKYHPEPLEINRVIQDLLKVVGRTAGRGIEIRTDLSPKVSNVIGDESQLHHGIMNLCLNACEAMPKGGKLTVRTVNVKPDKAFLALHREMIKGSYVAVSISDTGAGMNPKVRERIFEPFFTTKSEISGTGLGLSMAGGIVANHGGCITVESEPEKGSSFTVYLPATGKKVKKSPAKPVGTLKGTETILVVDDEKDFRDSIGRLLKGLGYTVLEAESGEKAVEMIGKRGEDIDLVLLDMIMKGMSGEETFGKIQAISPGLPVIICTGFSVDRSCQLLLETGAMDLIQKPFDDSTLAFKLRKVLVRRKKKRGHP